MPNACQACAYIMSNPCQVHAYTCPTFVFDLTGSDSRLPSFVWSEGGSDGVELLAECVLMNILWHVGQHRGGRNRSEGTKRRARTGLMPNRCSTSSSPGGMHRDRKKKDGLRTNSRALWLPWPCGCHSLTPIVCDVSEHAERGVPIGACRSEHAERGMPGGACRAEHAERSMPSGACQPSAMYRSYTVINTDNDHRNLRCIEQCRPVTRAGICSRCVACVAWMLPVRCMDCWNWLVASPSHCALQACCLCATCALDVRCMSVACAVHVRCRV